jgi:hypothetical protein
MQIERTDLEAAVKHGLVAEERAASLWSFLEQRHPAPRFNGLNVAYYFGALVVIAAMGWLMTLGFTSLGPWAVFGIAVLYALVFVRAGAKLFPELPTPGGLLYAMAVCMTPLAIWGLERGTGFWPAKDPGEYRDFFPYIRASWILMEAGTVVAALFALRKLRFPFLVAPAAVALWFMSMDLAAYWSKSGEWDFDLGRRVSLVFGIVMVVIAWLADRRSSVDLSFWLYLFCMTALWGALSSMDSHDELGLALYCLLNLIFIVASVLLRRRVFLVYGALGVNGYLATLAWRVFKDSFLAPIAFTALGLSIIWLAVQYQRNQKIIEPRIVALIPKGVREFLSPTAG